MNSQVFGKACSNHVQQRQEILQVAQRQLLSRQPLRDVINRERHPTAHERLVMWLQAQVFWVAECKSFRHREERMLFADEHSLFPDTEVNYGLLYTTHWHVVQHCNI